MYGSFKHATNSLGHFVQSTVTEFLVVENCFGLGVHHIPCLTKLPLLGKWLDHVKYIVSIACFRMVSISPILAWLVSLDIWEIHCKDITMLFGVISLCGASIWLSNVLFQRELCSSLWEEISQSCVSAWISRVANYWESVSYVSLSFSDLDGPTICLLVYLSMQIYSVYYT